MILTARCRHFVPLNRLCDFDADAADPLQGICNGLDPSRIYGTIGRLRMKHPPKNHQLTPLQLRGCGCPRLAGGTSISRDTLNHNSQARTRTWNDSGSIHLVILVLYAYRLSITSCQVASCMDTSITVRKSDICSEFLAFHEQQQQQRCQGM